MTCLCNPAGAQEHHALSPVPKLPAHWATSTLRPQAVSLTVTHLDHPGIIFALEKGSRVSEARLEITVAEDDLELLIPLGPGMTGACHQAPFEAH